MANVYIHRFVSDDEDISRIGAELLKTLVEKEHITLKKEVPMKVHFGEKGNITFIRPCNFEGIIEYLRTNKVRSRYMETLVLYGGCRNRKEPHIKTAKEHGFTQLPITIADGDHGEEYDEIRIDKKHYSVCKIGRGLSRYKQMIVISHFKGHMLAGFGGAIKQLSMGFAAKGGKLAMHMGNKPKVVRRKCIRCARCLQACNEDAITITGRSAVIDHDRCVGCGGFTVISPTKAITPLTLKDIFNTLFQGGHFHERLSEYAFATALGKEFIYINYIMNVTKGCDCIGKPMRPIMDDIGILASTDPVALDKACCDLTAEHGKRFKGLRQIVYAESIGLGEQEYELIDV